MEKMIIDIISTSLAVGFVIWYILIEKPRQDKWIKEVTDKMLSIVEEYDRKVDHLHDNYLEEYKKEQSAIYNIMKELKDLISNMSLMILNKCKRDI